MCKNPHPRHLRYFLSLVAFLFLTVNICSAQDGEAIFKANCSTCHSIKEKVIGPALKNVQTRHSEEWLLKWIRNSQTLVKAGDADAVKLFNDNNKIVMTPFSLKDAEIKAVLAYIKTESEKPEAAAPATPAAGQPVEEQPSHTWIYLLGIAIILIAISGILRRVKNSLYKAIRKKHGLAEPPPMSFFKQYWNLARNHKKIVALALILLFMWGSVEAWYGMMGIGVTQGYLPDQPIAYSHKLHAGDMKISCIYCHSGAEKGKTAGIPSANVCMNCHKFVKKGRMTGTVEIAKIYKALDYDPDKMTYGPNQHPIQWTRVHNLPDLAYFNHAQHFVVGKIACQTCHGPVQDSMTVISQYSKLTMGWCIDCHRTTQVKMAGNAYYNELHAKLLDKLKDSANPDSMITVESMGGTECARCHY